MARKGSKETKRVLMAGAATLLIGGAVLAGAGTLKAGDHAAIPETLDLNLQLRCPNIAGLPKDKKAVYGFTHKKHIEFLQAKVGREDKGKVCTTCHKGEADPTDLSKDHCTVLEEELEESGGPKKMAVFFHNTCKGCHLDMKKAGEKSGPVKCSGCHSRKPAKEVKQN